MKRWLLFLCSSVTVFVITCGASYWLRSDGHGLPGVQDGIRRLGFPSIIWEEGGFAYHQTFHIAALLADLAAAAIAGLVISMWYSRVIPKPNAKRENHRHL